MKKGTALAAILLILLTLSIPASAQAGQKHKSITPYGDFCDRVSHYGMQKHMLNDKGVKDALSHYYGKKGFDFTIVNSKGRFVKATIKKRHKVVDTIIFDRHTGRIRSIN